MGHRLTETASQCQMMRRLDGLLAKEQHLVLEQSGAQLTQGGSIDRLPQVDALDFGPKSGCDWSECDHEGSSWASRASPDAAVRAAAERRGGIESGKR